MRPPLPNPKLTFIFFLCCGCRTFSVQHCNWGAGVQIANFQSFCRTGWPPGNPHAVCVAATAEQRPNLALIPSAPQRSSGEAEFPALGNRRGWIWTGTTPCSDPLLRGGGGRCCNFFYRGYEEPWARCGSVGKLQLLV